MATDRQVKEAMRRRMAEIAAQRVASQEGNVSRREVGAGLGKGLAQILEDTSPPDRPNAYQLQFEDSVGNFRVSAGLGALFPSGTDFGPYSVSQAQEYYQGPSNSTRVASHQFIPSDPNWEDRASQGYMDANTLRGHIYVRFWRKTGVPKSPQGDLWKYGPCSLSDYRMFREASSKGRAVRSLEAFGHGSANGMSPDGLSI